MLTHSSRLLTVTARQALCRRDARAHLICKHHHPRLTDEKNEPRTLSNLSKAASGSSLQANPRPEGWRPSPPPLSRGRRDTERCAPREPRLRGQGVASARGPLHPPCAGRSPERCCVREEESLPRSAGDGRPHPLLPDAVGAPALTRGRRKLPLSIQSTKRSLIGSDYYNQVRNAPQRYTGAALSSYTTRNSGAQCLTRCW